MDPLTEQPEPEAVCWWPYLVTFILFVIGAIKLYIGGSNYASNNRIDGKVVVITGGSTGIGLATAKELSKRGGTIILAVRNAKKGKKALQEIKQVYPEADAMVKLVDLTDFVSIREFSNQIALEHDKIDILINNAGIIFHPYKTTVDGNEITIATNYFGPFLLTHLLLNLLAKSDQGRVINLSAVAHFRSKLRLDNLNSEKSFVPIEAFSQSKLALTMFTKYMASILKHTNITFYAVNPGLVRGTGHLRYSRLMTSFITKFSVWPWIWLFMKTPEQGCQSVVYAAVDQLPRNLSGCYLSNCTLQKASTLTDDIELLDKLYEKTCEIINISGKNIINNITECTIVKDI